MDMNVSRRQWMGSKVANAPGCKPGVPSDFVSSSLTPSTVRDYVCVSKVNGSCKDSLAEGATPVKVDELRTREQCTKPARVSLEGPLTPRPNGLRRISGKEQYPRWTPWTALPFTLLTQTL